jgi:TolA-binding protein
MRAAVILALLLTSAAALAAPPATTCGSTGEYQAALCAYQRREFQAAERGFRTIMERDAHDPVTLHATYFLARTLMKTGRFDDAAELFVRIYSLDAPFYQAWNCDFLLGECRRAVGKT